MKLKTVSYNIHKGFGQISRKLVLSEIRDLIRYSNADVVFLQEVVGANHKHIEVYKDWPEVSQFEYLADELWPHFSYGLNAVYDHGHHGNAILSRFPIEETFNTDISKNSYEKRGFLYCRIKVPDTGEFVNLVCLHLNLFEKHRWEQLLDLVKFLETRINPKEPLIVAGDFNDWTGNISRELETTAHLIEGFKKITGHYAPTYPAIWPVLRLDRIFARNVQIESAEILRSKNAQKLSDHLPICVEVSW